MLTQYPHTLSLVISDAMCVHCHYNYNDVWHIIHPRMDAYACSTHCRYCMCRTFLHRDCRRIAMATAHSSKASFDHCVTVVNSMLQRSDDIFEPDTLDNIAIKAFWPDADVSTGGDKGQLLSGVVRRQLALYHRELVTTSHSRKKTMHCS
jgi:hypothetical protein